MAVQDQNLILLLEQLFFGRTIEIQQPLQVTVLGTDFGATIVGVQSDAQQNIAASALDLARQTAVNAGTTGRVEPGQRTANLTTGNTFNISNTMASRMTGGGY